VVSRRGHAPRWRELVLDEPAMAGHLVPPETGGTIFRGEVLSEDLRAYPPKVSAHPVEGLVPDTCVTVLQALGVLQADVDGGGGFELGPLPAGRWQLTMEAESHVSVSVEVTAAQDRQYLVLAPISLQPVSTVLMRVESLYESPPYSVQVKKGERDTGEPAPRFREVFVKTLSSETEATVELDPGVFRFILTKPGTQLGLVEEVQLFTGFQELVLRPVPVVVKGKLLRERQGVAKANLHVSARGHAVEVMTDGFGEFEIPLWTLQRHVVEVVEEDGRKELLFLDTSGAEPGEEVQQDLVLSSRSVSGVVLDADSGAPIAGATVLLRQSSPDRRDVFQLSEAADDAGGFSFSLKEGVEVELAVRAKGYLPEKAYLGHEPAPSVTIRLTQGNEVSGRVLGAAGEAIAGVRVAVSPGNPMDRPAIVTTSLADGSFEIVCPRGSTLIATAANQALGWAPASDSDVVIRLLPLQVPTAFVVQDPDRVPIPNARLAVVTPEGFVVPFSEMRRALEMSGIRPQTGPDGVLMVPVLPPGTYRVLLGTRAGSVAVGLATVPSPAPIYLSYSGEGGR